MFEHGGDPKQRSLENEDEVLVLGMHDFKTNLFFSDISGFGNMVGNRNS